MIISQKNSLRVFYKLLLKKINTTAYYSIATKMIHLKLLSFLERSNIQDILTYYPIQYEVDLKLLYQQLFLTTKKIYFPKMSSNKMYFYYVSNLRELQKTESFNIPQPIGKSQSHTFFDIKTPSKNTPVIIIPGLVFDTTGHRIGFGKGYFDRFLQDNNIFSIGVAFEKQIVQKIKHDKWDIPVNIIITEKYTRIIDSIIKA